MDEENIRIYFLGSGELGIRCVKRLEGAEGIEVVGIATQPDRPAGRRKKPQPTPFAVKLEAEGYHLERAADINGQDFLEELSDLKPHLILVASFGQLLKQKVLNLPVFGCVNIHGSLLPKYRGASPVQAAIRNGDTESGISFMKMEPTLDTGPIYKTARCQLAPDETTASLELKLGELAAAHVTDCVKEICEQQTQPVPQVERLATFAPKLKKKDAQIDWNAEAVQIERDVRAFYPWPLAWFELSGKEKRQRIQVAALSVTTVPAGTSAAPGTVLQADKNGWVIACGNGAVRLEKVIPAGKKPMSGPEFLRGTPIQAGEAVIAAA